MITPNPSTTPNPQSGRTAHPGANFARVYGPAARPRRAKGAIR
ncbi:hypothetical protein [Streptomyces sp. bgisy060]